MLQAGDRILFVDNISLRNKTVNEINQLLRANEEVVKLKIKKDEVYTGKRERVREEIPSFLCWMISHHFYK
jgi:C-terminal processing protease CtpA/Prc